jgi:hypothetical protein
VSRRAPGLLEVSDVDPEEMREHAPEPWARNLPASLNPAQGGLADRHTGSGALLSQFQQSHAVLEPSLLHWASDLI